MRRAPTSTEEFERRPKTARNSEIDTKTKQLNAAERLFSDKGLEAVSHRDIALAATVNLAALNYHFGSRQAFIRAVIKRRVEPINAHRLAALARAERQMGGAPVPADKFTSILNGQFKMAFGGDRASLTFRPLVRWLAQTWPETVNFRFLGWRQSTYS